MRENPKKVVYIANDNDEGGRRGMEAIENLLKKEQIDIEIKERLPEIPGADWNEILQQGMMKGSPCRFKE